MYQQSVLRIRIRKDPKLLAIDKIMNSRQIGKERCPFLKNLLSPLYPEFGLGNVKRPYFGHLFNFAAFFLQ
jgi:hypothetical protein